MQRLQPITASRAVCMHSHCQLTKWVQYCSIACSPCMVGQSNVCHVCLPPYQTNAEPCTRLQLQLTPKLSAGPGPQVRDVQHLNLKMFIKDHLNTLKYLSFLKQRGAQGSSFIAAANAGK